MFKVWKILSWKSLLDFTTACIIITVWEFYYVEQIVFFTHAFMGFFWGQVFTDLDKVHLTNKLSINQVLTEE